MLMHRSIRSFKFTHSPPPPPPPGHLNFWKFSPRKEDKMWFQPKCNGIRCIYQTLLRCLNSWLNQRSARSMACNFLVTGWNILKIDVIYIYFYFKVSSVWYRKRTKLQYAHVTERLKAHIGCVGEKGGPCPQSGHTNRLPPKGNRGLSLGQAKVLYQELTLIISISILKFTLDLPKTK